MDTTEVDARIAAMDPADPELRARSDAALARILGRHGKLPTLADYRRVYDSLAKLGIDWPGDDRIREMYPVAP